MEEFARLRSGLRPSRSRLAAAGALAAALLLAPASHAFRFDTGNSDLNIRWDNTLKYSTAYRVEGQSDKLIDTAKNPNNSGQDDGDRNFDKGFISQRLDLLSEFDAAYKDFGLRVSGAAWYDFVYNRRNDNDSPGTFNPYSVEHDEFTEDTEELHGKNAELLDAFVFGQVDAGRTTTNFRLGQFAMQWGESLFFGNNGIAGGMAPVDVVKALSVPNSQFKEIIRPVPQVSGQIQIGQTLALGAYYQFRWEKSRLPAVGSYFSTGDILDDGGERLILGGPITQFNEAGPPTVGSAPEAWFRGDDEDAKDSGQGGVQARMRAGGVDLGVYAIRYHDKGPQLYARMYKVPGTPLGLPPPPDGPPVFNPGAINLDTGKSGEYYLVYPENIQAYGVSASTTFGEWNWATEFSMRRNTPLVSSMYVYPDGTDNPDNDNNARYAVGRSVHGQVSWFAAFGSSFLARESSFLGEVAWNRRTSIQKNPEALDANATKDAWGFRMVFEPTYRQVLSGLDLSVPVGLAYFPKGASSVIGAFGPDKGGDLSVGLNAVYLDVWRFGLAYTHFYGPVDGALDESSHLSFKQSLADRDFVSFTARRTF